MRLAPVHRRRRKVGQLVVVPIDRRRRSRTPGYSRSVHCHSSSNSAWSFAASGSAACDRHVPARTSNGNSNAAENSVPNHHSARSDAGGRSAPSITLAHFTQARRQWLVRKGPETSACGHSRPDVVSSAPWRSLSEMTRMTAESRDDWVSGRFKLVTIPTVRNGPMRIPPIVIEALGRRDSADGELCRSRGRRRRFPDALIVSSTV